MELSKNLRVADDNFRAETKKEYWDRLNQSIQDIDDGKGVIFTMDELKEYIGLPHP